MVVSKTEITKNGCKVEKQPKLVAKITKSYCLQICLQEHELLVYDILKFINYFDYIEMLIIAKEISKYERTRKTKKVIS